ncbi:conserved hypothetical protein [Treponema primitia ZAS-2]|uniref:DUF4139 domain-containing protein n=1 Tax=Treponema primitia (strain ATCC BAA-887 / DSM 12427 / ZAS-2) TaxID=545694 RepID=F5YLZ1_TREPZ|nr:hypothetical protein [Treponema primitia]AEF84745.1 conserved hypothetical protein [Treponema primitia ZAS-2]
MRKNYLMYPLLLTLAFSLNGTGFFAQSMQDREPPGTRGGSGGPANSGPAAEGELPLRRVSLFSSGVAYFEHAGELSGSAEIPLPFNAGAVNDALKSLVINDSGSHSPSVQYPSEQTLYRTLRSLRIDLSGNPGAAEILQGLRGAEILVNATPPVSGRILGIEYRSTPGSGIYGGEPVREAWLSLVTSQGIRVMAVKDMVSFSFTDPSLNGDIQRALDLIMESRQAETRTLRVVLPAQDRRTVSLSYVIPAPVWKVSYRLDLSREQPLLQGWAIVDNDGDTDWNRVELSLVTGRPVSFIQNLYPPYYLDRPTLPLAIAGAAEARSYDSGWGGAADAEALMETREYAPQAKSLSRAPVPAPPRDGAAYNSAMQSLAGGAESASGRELGDQFEFTLKDPVTLARQQSAMFPLVEGTVGVKKTLVFSGERAAQEGIIHPAISAELTNTTGMKLPAGPVTVFDGGSYAGDALLGFFPTGEKRLISYGEDLSVSGAVIASSTPVVRTVTISGGVMVIARRISFERSYTINNASGERKQLILEHPITAGTALVMPAEFDERTDTLYRFSMNLSAERELTITIREELPLEERIVLTQLLAENFAAYATNQEIPANARAALQQAIELKKAADTAKAAQLEIEGQRTYRTAEQDRIRRNLEAAGNQTPQGQEYLKRLVAMDTEIDALSASVDEARKTAQAAQKEYEDYLGRLDI